MNIYPLIKIGTKLIAKPQTQAALATVGAAAAPVVVPIVVGGAIGTAIGYGAAALLDKVLD